MLIALILIVTAKHATKQNQLNVMSPRFCHKVLSTLQIDFYIVSQRNWNFGSAVEGSVHALLQNAPLLPPPTQKPLVTSHWLGWGYIEKEECCLH